MNLEVKNVSWGVNGNTILNNISLNVKLNEVIGVLGPNGSGKSSLLKTIYKINKPASGMIELNGRDVWKMTARELAREMAVMTQEYPVDFSFSVKEIVLLGRLPFKSGYSKYTDEEYLLMESSLERVDSLHLVDRDFHTLSGGEKQRVLLARALVQEPQMLILDEPTNHLDIHFQIEILEVIKSLRITSVIAIHDLNLACRYCDRVYILNKGEIQISGKPTEVCTFDTIQDIYKVDPSISFNKGHNSLELQFYKLKP
jgi:iron complex transport system ATP-binding protein